MPGRVLVVDDYEDGRLLVVLTLEAEGYEVVTASGGADAVEQARLQPPSAIVMDLYMPDLDGIEATRRLKADPKLHSVPVIAYTAYPERATSSGLFHSICPKPCAPDKLLRLVREAIAA